VAFDAVLRKYENIGKWISIAVPHPALRQIGNTLRPSPAKRDYR
jgi:hypothetical protein